MRRHASTVWAVLLLSGLVSGCSLFRSNPPAAVPAPPATDPAPLTPAVARPATPADARPVIVCLGDSLTFGLGVAEKENYPAQLQQRLDAAGYHYRVVNLGISGDTSGGGLSRLQGAIDLHPKVVILELGANDGLRGLPVAETHKNLARIVEQSQAAGATVVMAGMQVPPNLGTEYTTAFAAMFAELARQYGTPLIPFFLDGVGGVRELNQNDGLHPTADGYRLVVDNVWKTLSPLLQK